MMVIIMGEDRSEFCVVPKKNKEKHFIKIRKSQLYKVYPNGLARCKIDYFGERVMSDEVITYAENETVPYIIKMGVRYGMEPLLQNIDAHKQMTNGSWFKKKPWFSPGGGGFLISLLKNPAFWLILIGGIFCIPMLPGLMG